MKFSLELLKIHWNVIKFHKNTLNLIIKSIKDNKYLFKYNVNFNKF